MIGLNLLPDIKKEFIAAQRTRNFVISLSILAVIIAGGLTVFLALFVYVGQSTAIGLQKDSINKNHAELASKPEIEKYLTIQSQLEALNSLHGGDNKSIYSRIFDYLVKLNPAEPHSVSLSSVKVNKEGYVIEMQGTTSDFRSLDVFKNTLEKAVIQYSANDENYEKPLFSEVNLKTASLSDSAGRISVSFEFGLVYAPEAFSVDVSNIQLVVPKQVVSDSQNNAPSAIFDQPQNQGGAN